MADGDQMLVVDIAAAQPCLLYTSPIHHAFEMRGWREVKIDAFFALIAIIGVAMGIFYICVA